MLVEVIEVIETKKGTLKPGDRVEIPDSVIKRLNGKVRTIRNAEIFQAPARIEAGELRLLSPVDDLAAIIVGLTESNLDLQKKLLLKHCQEYAPSTHFWSLREKWEERAAILKHDAGLSRDEAELEAAKMYRLQAFMDELRGEPHGENAAF